MQLLVLLKWGKWMGGWLEECKSDFKACVNKQKLRWSSYVVSKFVIFTCSQESHEKFTTFQSTSQGKWRKSFL
jgi:hypothetical protein